MAAESASRSLRSNTKRSLLLSPWSRKGFPICTLTAVSAFTFWSKAIDLYTLLLVLEVNYLHSQPWCSLELFNHSGHLWTKHHIHPRKAAGFSVRPVALPSPFADDSARLPSQWLWQRMRVSSSSPWSFHPETVCTHLDAWMPVSPCHAGALGSTWRNLCVPTRRP